MQRLLAFAILLTSFAYCKHKPDSTHIVKNKELMISKEQAIEIANKDAALHYNDLSIYTINAQLIDNNWKVDYELKNKRLDGGGPHYLISARSGEIIESHFQQ